MDNLTILSIILVCVAIVTFYFMGIMPKNDKKVDVSAIPDKDLRPYVEMLLNKLEDTQQEDRQLREKLSSLEQEDRQLREKLSGLQYMQGIQSEQTKYLTANVNKTLSTTA